MCTLAKEKERERERERGMKKEIEAEKQIARGFYEPSQKLSINLCQFEKIVKCIFTVTRVRQ